MAAAYRVIADPTLLDEVEAYLVKWGVAPCRFGRLAVRSEQFVSSLRAGRACRPSTEARVRAFMAKGDPGPAPRRFIMTSANTTANVSRSSRRNAAAERRSSEFRLSDPVERAKTFIRSRGWHCFEAAITRPELHGKFFVGARVASRDELLDFARRKGWGG